ncbi:atp-dependent rna helicase chl1 [Diplodia corticola]|uniref:ATP-dependent DNA helicase CHL1 n=1 Tax=Diplodia corticola TaxID=236234 RepID=A0A1J9RBZ7_9PEZI|nr:atp-dependent rna helicase chl1 [Diplodia corticola]OJD29995.1 atp-dependent rna helicase chl1 [Diplodia corticola]
MAPNEPSASLLAAQQRNFHHPYEPYEIQKQLMSALYECIETGKVGIFESPTGEPPGLSTGKSLSLICASLTWLRDHKRRTFEEGLATETLDQDEPEWMLEYARGEKRRAALQQRADLEERLARVRAKEKKLKERYSNGEPHFKRQKTAATDPDLDDDDEARFVLDDYESDDETAKMEKSHRNPESGYSAETEALMKKLGMPIGKKGSDEDSDVVDELKVFYCSRTHSQLSQFSGELRRVRMPPAITSTTSNAKPDADDEVGEAFKHLTLGSRKNLCINPKVQKLASTALINEKCLDLQKPGTAADHKCSFLPTKETEAIVNDFRDHALADVRDIEDLGAIGKKLGVCPYYASRPAVKPSEIVTLPYPLLLQKSAREALDINMKDHVVIIDEAHNLMDAINGIYSVSVSLSQLQRSRSQLTTYLQKFRNRLKGKNRVYVAQTVRLLDSLVGYLQGTAAKATDAEGVVQIGDLMSGKGVDQINLYKLLRYLDESKLARKVDGYIVYAEEHDNDKAAASRRSTQPREAKSSMPVLMHIQSFFYALLNPSAEGRFFYAKDDDDLGLCLKYMLLDPTHHFREIVDSARAVILAGGTMSPMSDYSQHLLSYLPASRIMTLSCGHVIPPSNLLAWPVTSGPSGAPFDFRFEKRNSEAMMVDLGAALLTFTSAIPDGVVVFFPSYAYLDRCLEAWRRVAAPPSSSSTSTAKTMYAALASIKPIFHEAKTKAATSTATTPPMTTDAVLAAYTHAVTTAPGGRGALLLAVVGGSLSEGINFSDSLGRGVVVVGLPYPPAQSAEWKARLGYVARKAREGGESADGKHAAREFYENACMRAVNQCVGRAIRHRGDYAAVLLVDRRYEGGSVRAKLPGWIRGSLKSAAGAEVVGRGLEAFFREKARG